MKMYPALKRFIHEAYGWQLAAIELRNTSGQNRYSPDQNIYNTLDGANDTDNDTVTTVTQAAAAAMATGSTTTTTTIVIPPEITAAINQPLEVQSKMIFMGHQISSYHVPVVRSFFIL
jgi:hypothetical protein